MPAPTTPAQTKRPFLDRRCRWALAAFGVCVSVAGGLFHAIQAEQVTTASPAFAAVVSKVSALPTPSSKRLVWITYGESKEVESGHAARRSSRFLPGVAFCNVVMHPPRPGAGQLAGRAGVTDEQEAMLWLLHEKGHCLSDANWNGTRAGLAEPDAAKLEKGATPELVKSVAEESYADAYALLWMAKLNPQRAHDFHTALVGYRELELKDATNGYLTPLTIKLLKDQGMPTSFGVDDHYTVPALEVLEAELAGKTAGQMANLTADEIQETANRVSLESARQHVRALGVQ